MSSNKLEKLLLTSWLIYLKCMTMHGLANFKSFTSSQRLSFLSPYSPPQLGHVNSQQQYPTS